jgi:hypothetical protein
MQNQFQCADSELYRPSAGFRYTFESELRVLCSANIDRQPQDRQDLKANRCTPAPSGQTVESGAGDRIFRDCLLESLRDCPRLSLLDPLGDPAALPGRRARFDSSGTEAMRNITEKHGGRTICFIAALSRVARCCSVLLLFRIHGLWRNTAGMNVQTPGPSQPRSHVPGCVVLS